MSFIYMLRCEIKKMKSAIFLACGIANSGWSDTLAESGPLGTQTDLIPERKENIFHFCIAANKIRNRVVQRFDLNILYNVYIGLDHSGSQ